ncbi:DUF5004 domain-containing protein [Galbibacter sp. BG1]|uniref:DUF5004 domain-containing protein n=1 Tax=Galbibacter sp. BG1 TaxID=1170699 RepID=UPI0015BCC65C|nr:DUF5004 domain-containing protein [Galbibacter sp. BG1]QLE00996.1 DUF5004 domain-containing protein [Galbibacter sp. BG1]
MKTRKLIAASLFVALSGLFIGCNDDDGASCAQDYTGALSEQEASFAGTWTLTGIESSEAIDLTDDDVDNPSTDIFAQEDSCLTDIVYEYNTDRTFTYDQGKNTADCNRSEQFTGTWKLGGNTLGLITNCFESIEEISFSEDRTSYTVASRGIVTDANGQRQEVDLTFTYTQGPMMVEPEPTFE